VLTTFCCCSQIFLLSSHTLAALFPLFLSQFSPLAPPDPDLIMCRKTTGIAVGRLCERCDGKCVICDSYVRPHTLVRLCNDCDFGSFQGRCTICGGVGVADAYYCKECVQQEKDVSALGAAGLQDALLWGSSSAH
jgi:PHD finger-like domain-containing protein 5A